jgi:MFS family permease
MPQPAARLQDARTRAAVGRRRIRPLLAPGAILVGAVAVRLWGLRHGLPYAYNVDERAHYVPQALDVAQGDLDPNYFINPPAFTYLLGLVYRIEYGAGAERRFATDPESVLLTARLLSATLGAASVAATFAAGRAWFDRRTGLLAAAVMAVAFLPVFYARFGLGDAASVLPCALALWAAARIAGSGRLAAYALAGALAGLAAATKYTAGAVLALVPLAAVLASRSSGGRDRRRTVGGVALAAGAALAAFAVANPYALLDRATFVDDLERLRRFTAGAPLVGQVEGNGWAYYVTSLGWALGIVPAVAALGGLVLLAVRRRRQALVLVPFVAGFVLYLGAQSRFYARWLLPLYPVLAIAAGYAGVAVVERLRRARLPEGLATALVAGALVVPAAVPTIRNARTLSREDTRSEARRWLVDHLPRRTRVVFEPSAPAEWYGVTAGGGAHADPHRRWRRFHRGQAVIAEQASTFPGVARSADFLNYPLSLSPALVGIYAQRGYCWVVTVSDQAGRAHLEPERVPEAIAYYHRLQRASRIAFTATPLAPGERLPRYQFDRSFNYVDAAYRRPGPLVTVRRLTTGRCARTGP